MEKHSYSNALARAFLILTDNDVDNSVAFYLMEEMLGWTHSKFLMHQNEEMNESDYERFFELIKRASKNEPPQYILGEAWFYGRKFQVTTDTLIPRQETEELVAKVLQDIVDQRNLDILDIGTGTGDIAITLALEQPENHCVGADISEAALQVAQTNATQLQAQVSFVKSDLFDSFGEKKFDVIISNPPYIAEDERTVMDASVLQYEPTLALFAANDGLEIYQRFFAELEQHLKNQGCAYLEFGYQQKNALSQIISEQLPNYEVEFYQDLTGNWRYLKMYRKEKLV